MKKIITIFALLAFTFTVVHAQVHSTQTGQNFLTATSLKDGVAAATNSYLVSLQIHAGSTFYINNEGKAQTSFSTTGETTWIVEKTSDDKYLLRTFSGNYIKTLGSNNSTALTFTTNSSEALKFNPVQSASTDGNMESGYVANKAIWWNVDGGDKRINTNGISGTNKTIFQNNGEGCWTCLFTYKVTIPSGYNGYIGATKTITSTEWTTKGNWVYTDTWKDNGPGTTGSNMWSPIYLQDVTATGIAFEGWNLRINLVNSSLTATTNKIQAGGTVTIGVDENSTLYLTMTAPSTAGQNDPGTHTFNIDGTLNIKTVANHWKGTSNNNINLGTTGQFAFTADGAVTVPSSASFSINATLKDPTEHNTVESRTLATFTNVTVSSLSHNISGTDGWTLVADRDALTTETTGEGKYYYVETSSTGITLYTYQKTYNVTYEVVDEDNNVLFTSDPVTMNQGTAITTLPAEYQKTLFYTYNTISETADADKTVTFTATLKDSNLPFIPSTSFASATWYNLTLSDTPNYVTYKSGGTQNVTLPTSFTDDATTQWAFIGNPYTGFKIVNRAAGASLVLGSATTTNAQNDGQSIYATLQIEGQQTNEVWNPEATTATQSYYTGKVGFFLRNTEGHALNKRNGTSNISYWTKGADNGSTFVATKVPTLSELVTEARTLYTTLNDGRQNVQIGYPTESALTTFKSAIDDAENEIGGTDSEEYAAWVVLKAAITTVKSPANTVYTPRTDVYYTITSARGSMIYEPTYAERDTDNNTDEFVYHTGNTSGTKNGKTHINVSLDPTNPNHQWGFIYYDNKYYMYNVGKKQFAGIGKGNYGATWTFSNTPSSVTLDAGINNSVVPSDVRVRATSAVTGQTYSMSISPGFHGPVITYDAQGDGGIPMTFAVATTTQDATVTAVIEALLEDLTPYRVALQDAIDAADALKAAFGTGLNQYSVTGGEDAFNTALADAKTEVAKADIETSKADLITAREALETAQAGLTKSINQPTAGFYRIKGKTSGNYLAAGMANEKFAMSAATDGTTVFYFDGYQLINLSSGMSNGMTSSNWGWVKGSDASTVTFSDGGTYGGYAIQSADAYFYDGGTNADRGSSLGSNERYRNWYLTEVSSLPVTISSAGYATLYAPVALTIPNDVDVYIASDEGEYLHLIEIEGQTIPANTGVILAGSQGSYDFDITTGGSVGTNALTGTVAAIERPQNSYILSNGGSGVGFYKDGATVIPGFKAYLPASAGARGFLGFNFDEVTAITAIEAAQNPGKAVYDLSGRRVENPSNGLYIVNGKKVIINKK